MFNLIDTFGAGLRNQGREFIVHIKGWETNKFDMNRYIDLNFRTTDNEYHIMILKRTNQFNTPE